MSTLPMRGQVWNVKTVLGRTFTGLVASNDSVNTIYRRAHLIPIRPPDDVLITLVTVELSAPVPGVAVVFDTTVYRVDLFDSYLGSVEHDTMERINTAIRASFDLPAHG